MPPRKSAASTAAPSSPTAANNADVSMLSTTSAVEPKSPTTKKSGSKQQDDSSVGIEDLLLPRSLTSRIARGVLPANTSLQKDAVLALTKSATVFISYLASHANEQRPSAKTVTPGDVLNALKEIELAQVMDVGKVDPEGKLSGRLEREIAAYEEIIKGKRKGYRDKVKARESGLSVVDGEGVEGGNMERGEPETKRVRRSSGDSGGDYGERDQRDEDRDDEDALLDAQLNGEPGNDDTELEEPEHEDEDEDEEADDENEQDEPEEAEEQDQDEDIDRIDVEDGEPAPLGRRVSSRSTKGRHSMLSPNGRAELGSDDDSD